VNLYVVDGGDVTRWLGGYDPPESYRAIGVFAAETPGQAKADALREFNNDVEWTDLRVRIAYRGVTAERGLWNDQWPEGPWLEDENVAPPEPFASVDRTVIAMYERDQVPA